MKKLKKLTKVEAETKRLERQEIKRTLIEFNRFSNDLNVELIKVYKKSIPSTAATISDRKILK